MTRGTRKAGRLAGMAAVAAAAALATAFALTAGHGPAAGTTAGSRAAAGGSRLALAANQASTTSQASTARQAGTARGAASGLPPQCATGGLEVWLGFGYGGAAMGSTTYPLEFTNVSQNTCVLYGYPGVSALGTDGRQLGSAASRAPIAPQTVTLAPHANAHSALTVVDIGGYPVSRCHPAAADALRVYPPDQYSATEVPFAGQACASSGPVYLITGTIQPGVGVPGQG
jgi:hypothetical protein